MNTIQRLRNKISLPVGHACIGNRENDQYLISFPRSGSTWLRTMLVNIIVPGANSDPDVFNAVIPGVSITRIAAVRRLASPRIIHSHTSYRTSIKRVVYIVRDGRDVLISFYHYIVTRKGLSTPFSVWFDQYTSGTYGRRWDENVLSWMVRGKQALGENMLCINFETMKDKPTKTLIDVCEHLGIESTHEEIQAAIVKASIKNLRQIEQSRTKAAGGSENASFYRGGKTGQWEDYFTPDIEKRFMKLSTEAMLVAGYATNR